MGFNLWMWTVLAVGLFWSVGVYNRITRLRARSMESFLAVAEHLLRYRLLVTEHLDMQRVGDSPPDFQQLVTQLGQMELATKAARMSPWDKELLRAVTQAGAEVAATWGILRTTPADLAGAVLPEQLMRDWDGNSRLLHLAIASFNQILMAYNEAIAQFPALIITSFLGFKPTGQIAIFHEA